MLESPVSRGLAASRRRATFLVSYFSAEIGFYPSYALVKERSVGLRLLETVELDGIEPTTSSLQSWRSPN